MSKRSELITPSRSLPYGGYISPKGEFYICPYGAHTVLADLIASDILGEKGRGQSRLESLGWLHLANDGTPYLHHLNYQLTQAQLDKLFDLANAPFDEELPSEISRWKYVGDWYIKAKPDEWRENIMDNIQMAQVA